MTLYTIGHSNHELSKFLDLLKKFNIKTLVDIRSIPYSRFNPQFNREKLIKELKLSHINYIYLGNKLGGMQRNTSIPKIKEDLLSALEELIKLLKRSNVTIMCAEENPLKCHRFFLVTRLVNHYYPHVKVFHIRGNGELHDNDSLVIKIREQEKVSTQLALPLPR